MKSNDIRVLRAEAKDLGIKYVTSYTKKELTDEIAKVRNEKALAELDAMMRGVSFTDLITPVVIDVKVPKGRPYKLNIIPQD